MGNTVAGPGRYSLLSHTHVSRCLPEDKRQSKKAKRERAARRAAEALGVVEIYPGDPQWAPEYERDTGSRNVRSHPSTQYHPDDLDKLAEDHISDKEFWRRRKELARVWEPAYIPPVIIDFSMVKEPLFPSRAHPRTRGSMAPNAGLWQEAIREAKLKWPRNHSEDIMARNNYWWDRIDGGTLPADFNPYPPGTDKHQAFSERVTLIDDRPRDATYDYLLTRRQTRRRARRKLEKGLHLSDEEFEQLFKPLAEWSMAELAEGYPRTDVTNKKLPRTATSSMFRGEMRERVREELERRVKTKLDGLAIKATQSLSDVLDNSEIDGRGRPVVPASVKASAAQYVIDRMLGKPTQHVETDLSAKLTAVLGDVMMAPEVSLTAEGVVATGALLTGQRGQRQDHQDDVLERVYRSTIGHEVRQLEPAYIDAEVVEDE
jgi:hypothetical protein